MEILKKTVSVLERIRARKPTMLVVKMALNFNVFWEKVKKLVKTVMVWNKVFRVERPLKSTIGKTRMSTSRSPNQRKSTRSKLKVMKSVMLTEMIVM